VALPRNVKLPDNVREREQRYINLQKKLEEEDEEEWPEEAVVDEEIKPQRRCEAC
jgi:hypothetical protein